MNAGSLWRRFPRIPAMVSLLVVVFGHSSPADEDRRPNFVWLISEDNSIHYMNLFFPGGAETPRIAEMAGHGILYRNAFSNAPVCSVARTTLITGCYAPRIGTQYHRKNVVVPMPDGLRMFPALLRQAGYYTTNNRKKDYNAREGDSVWDASSGKASWRNRADGQPFFHMQSFGVTHESSLHFPEKDITDKPTQADPATVTPADYHPDTPTFRYTYARYHDRIREMDGQIGRVLDQLEQDGLLEDTFVFYFGDHGGVLPRGKGYAYESGLHVPLVVRVPKNFADPKMTAGVTATGGVTSDRFVSFIDFGPTLLSLAGLTVPEQMDGRPFLGRKVGPDPGMSFGHADRFDEKTDFVRSYRRGPFVYERNYQPWYVDGLQNNYRYRMAAYREWRELYRQGGLNAAQAAFFEPRMPEALYDVRTDPHQVRNLATDPGFRETLQEMRQEMGQLQRSLPDLSFLPESALAEEAFADPAAWGQENRERLHGYMRLADLQTLPYAEARMQLAAAIRSDDPWTRYWGCTSAAVFGDQARGLVPAVREMVSKEAQALVKTRAAEFLWLVAGDDPRETISEALSQSESPIETELILNALVLIQDSPTGVSFELRSEQIPESHRSAENVSRRMEYLLPPR